MSGAVLTQKRLWISKKVTIRDGVLSYQHTGLFGGYAFEIKFEDIGNEQTTLHRPHIGFLLAATFLLLLSLVGLLGWTNVNREIALLGGLSAMGIYYVSFVLGQAQISLNTAKGVDLKFLAEAENEIEAESFLAELARSRKLFLVEKYWDCVDDYEEKIANLSWLKDGNIVNINEFKYLKEELFETETKHLVPIGFRKSA